MSIGPRTVLGTDTYGASTAPTVGCTNGSDSATPLYHMGTFSGACSDCHLSLLNSLRTRRGVPLMDRLERLIVCESID